MTDYIQLPRSALGMVHDKDLWQLYGYLLNKADKNGQLSISINYIAKDLKIGRSIIRNKLKKLKEGDLIRLKSTNSATIVNIVGDMGWAISEIDGLETAVFNKPEYRDIFRWVCNSGKISYGQGFVYAIEFGQFVKIGCSTSPYNRFMTLRGEFRRKMNLSPGRMAITPPCFNYKTLECEAHTHFASERISGSELFEVAFDKVVVFFETMSFL